MLKVLSLGAGVQSTAVLLMSCRGELPKLDAAVIADTQWEPAPVYRHLAWLTEKAKSHGIPVYRVTAGDLRSEALEFVRLGTKGFPAGKPRPMIPYYTLAEDGKLGMADRQCTHEYKIYPVENFIRRTLLGLKPKQVAPKDAVQHWFGISADEVQRVRTSRQHWQTFHYPLLSDVTSPKADTLFGRGYDRADCLDWIKQHGYPIPPRSACMGCPYHSDREWLRIKHTDPQGWADAVAFDHSIREMQAADGGLGRDRTGKKLDGVPYLHRTCVPLDLVQFNPADEQAALAYGMGNECAGVCGV